MFPPMKDSHSARLDATWTAARPLPVLVAGQSRGAGGNRKTPRVAVSHIATRPQSPDCPPSAHASCAPEVAIATTGAPALTVRSVATADAAPANAASTSTNG